MSWGTAGYRIVVGAQGIRVIARSPAGAFYGGVTLWQLLTPPGWTRGAAAEIAEGVIDDHPRFAWRALLLDSGRHFQSVADIKKLIDWMSLDKLNVLLWHLTEDQGWRLEIPKYPALTKTGACRKAVGLDIELTGAPDKPYCGFYTEAEVRDIVRYAAARFVTVVPEIDLPGHSQAAVAAYPWLGVTGKRPAVWTDWGVSPWLLKPDEKTLQFVDDVLDEVMRLFPSRYISIGGDEADKQQWNASPELRAQMQRLGLANMDQLQGWFTGRVADYLVKHGRTPVGWDDELVAGATLPASEVVMSWHGSDGEHVALKRPRKATMWSWRPRKSLYFDHYQSDLPDEGPGQPPMATLRQAYDTAVIPNGATAAEASACHRRAGRALDGAHAELRRTISMRCSRASRRCRSLAGRRRSAHDWNGFLQRLGRRARALPRTGHRLCRLGVRTGVRCDRRGAGECCASRSPTRRASGRSATPRTALRRLTANVGAVCPAAAVRGPGQRDACARRPSPATASTSPRRARRCWMRARCSAATGSELDRVPASRACAWRVPGSPTARRPRLQDRCRQHVLAVAPRAAGRHRPRHA